MGDESHSAQPTARPADPLGLVGQLIDGQFRVEEVVGLGELSVVYRGRHEGVDAPIAIKCLNLPLTLDGDPYAPLVESLREGARLHYQLGRRHVHVVQSVACGTTLAPFTGAKVPYMVREWLQGRSLAVELARQQSRTRTIREVVALLESAADALAFAHAQGISHQGLTPSNLFVAWTQEGPVVKVLDFGVAQVLNEHAVITAAGVREDELDAPPRVLRPAYAAPEQLDPSFGDRGPATDVYAFARIVYEALAGRAVFSADATAAEIVHAVRDGGPPSARAMGVVLPPEVEAVLTRALATSPAARFPDLRAFWDELARAAALAPKSMLPPATPKKPPPPMPARPTPPSYERASTTAEVAPAVASPSSPAIPVPGSRGAFQEEEIAELDDDDLIPLAGIVPSPVARLAAVGKTPRQRRWLAASGAASLAGLVILLAVTAPRAEAPGREARITTSHAVKALAASNDRRAPASMLLLPPEVVPSPPATQGAAAPRPPGPFSAALARSALADAAPDLAACIMPRGPRGPGSVRVRFNPSGKMAEAYLGPPYAGTATGRCILERFSKVRVDKFLGNPASVNYSFYSIPF